MGFGVSAISDIGVLFGFGVARLLSSFPVSTEISAISPYVKNNAFPYRAHG
jgi:hypothetical protein